MKRRRLAKAFALPENRVELNRSRTVVVTTALAVGSGVFCRRYDKDARVGFLVVGARET